MKLSIVNNAITEDFSEQEIIRECIRGNAKYQKMLFEKYSGKFMTICNRYATDQMEAEDMLQEGFIRIFKNLHQFKFEGSFEGWIRRIIVNACLKIIKSKKISLSIDDDSKVQIPDTNVSVSSQLSEEELLKLIKNLPTGYRIIFNLHAIEGYNHDEIGEMLNIKASTSRSQLVKARKMLQQQIINMQKIAV